MAIFKCPECGHQVSDKAPKCPSCGVEIAGHITTCKHCGQTYFNEELSCPNCHYSNPNQSSIDFEDDREEGVTNSYGNQREDEYDEEEYTENSVESLPLADSFVLEADRRPVAGETDDDGQKEKDKKSNRHSALLVSLLIAALICAVMFYFYQQAQGNQEQEAYEIALKSPNALTMQSYLDTYGNTAPREHINAIRSKLDEMKRESEEWTNALVSNTRPGYENYLKKHPDTPHKKLILNKIDSLDWVEAVSYDTEDSYHAYLEKHPAGAYISQADDAIKKLKVLIITAEEKQDCSLILKHFFQAINSKDQTRLLENVPDRMSSLLGESGAGTDKVIEFMEKMYKEDVTNLNWYLDPISTIEKEEIGDEQYQYKVQLKARKKVEKGEDVEEARYRISATISPAKKISDLNMVKLAEE